MAQNPVIFHMDLDAFFAAVEQLDHPQWRGQPVIVGAKPGGRGVVATCSYEARKFGVKSAMPINQAHALCPQGIFTPPRMDRYSQISTLVMKELENFSPVVRQVSVDEAFIDMTGTQGIFGPPVQAAQTLKDRLFEVTGGLTCSIGIAPTYFLAKIASDWQKPNGLFQIEAAQVLDFLDALPLKKLHGAGPKTQERLAEIGITNVRDLRTFPLEMLQSMVGQAVGAFLYKAVRGEEASHYTEAVHSHSASTETTFQEDTKNITVIRRKLLEMASQLTFRLLEEKKRSRTLSLKLRLEDFTTSTVQTTLGHYFTSSEEVFAQALDLLRRKWDQSRPLRLIGLSLDNLEAETSADQLDLFDDGSQRRRNLEKAVLKIRSKGIKITKADVWDQDSNQKE